MSNQPPPTLQEDEDAVDLIAAGYEWVCPECDQLNRVIEWREKVVCAKCKRDFEANPPEHAVG
ncbi:MAG: hypothetical protein WBM17_04415 [Anaerolineales bacterium]